MSRRSSARPPPTAPPSPAPLKPPPPKCARARNKRRPAIPDDARWLAAAARLAGRARPLSRPNPAVGAILVNDGRVVGRGWTRPGGRPHAEAVALAQAGTAAQGATLYVTLEPCAHLSARGPACADLIVESGIDRAVIGIADPDERTATQGFERLRGAGIPVNVIGGAAEGSLLGYLHRARRGRPHVTLKLALSQDARLAPREGQWLTGEAARAHVHAVRATMDAILVGAGTLLADKPRLDVRLPGIEARSPARWLLTTGTAPDGWRAVPSPEAIGGTDAQYLMVEGGAATARAFLEAGLVDRMMLYRAPLTVGGDGPALPELLPHALAGWELADSRRLGSDTLEVYDSRGPQAHTT